MSIGEKPYFKEKKYRVSLGFDRVITLTDLLINSDRSSDQVNRVLDRPAGPVWV
jgi:hypothetical protein